MSDEREIKTLIAGNSTLKNSSGDYVVVSFSEREIDDDPYYKVVIVKNSAVVKERMFSLMEFDDAAEYFHKMQTEYLGKIESCISFELWQEM